MLERRGGVGGARTHPPLGCATTASIFLDLESLIALLNLSLNKAGKVLPHLHFSPIPQHPPSCFQSTLTDGVTHPPTLTQLALSLLVRERGVGVGAGKGGGQSIPCKCVSGGDDFSLCQGVTRMYQ